jgi:hypothetical protein
MPVKAASTVSATPMSSMGTVPPRCSRVSNDGTPSFKFPQGDERTVHSEYLYLVKLGHILLVLRTCLTSHHLDDGVRDNRTGDLKVESTPSDL